MTPRPVKLSRAVQLELQQISGDCVVVAAVLTISMRAATVYADLGLHRDDGRIRTGPPAPPPRSRGLYARRNLDGWTDKRTDLPKEKRTISSWAPDWNNSGYHLITREVDAYPLEYHPAKLLTISATVLEELMEGAFVRFRVDQPLARSAEGFAADLKFNLCLLREAIGGAHVFDADLADEEYAKIQHVDWELLPRGSADRVLQGLASHKSVTPARLQVAAERLTTLDRLEHDGFIVGNGRFARYFGARFGERLVALENLEYGNALYVFDENWEQLTQLSRTELIRRRDQSVHRVPHVPGWQSAVRKLLRSG